MLSLILRAVKKVIIAIFLLYGLNLIISSLNILIPINVITVALVAILGIPGICTLVALFFLL